MTSTANSTAKRFMARDPNALDANWVQMVGLAYRACSTWKWVGEERIYRFPDGSTVILDATTGLWFEGRDV